MLDSFKFLLMICFVPFLSFIGGAIYTSAFPELGLVFNASSTLIKFSLTIYFIGMILGTILSGPLSDLYGRLYILVFFLILFFLSSVFCGFSTSIFWFSAGRFFQGLASAAGPIIIISLVADQFEGPEYNKYMAYVLIMIGIGHGVAPIIGSFILHFFDWRSIFYFLMIASLLALWIIFSVGVEKKVTRPEVKEVLLEYFASIKNPFFRYYCLIIGVFYGAINAIIMISPYIFRLHYGWSIVEFAWVGLALAIGDSMGAFFNDILLAKRGSQKIVITGLVLSGIALVMLLLIELPLKGIWFLLMITLFTMGANLTAACLTTNAIKVNPQFTGISSSLVYLSKFTICSIVLVLVLFLPNSLFTINLFLFLSIIVSVFGYWKIRKVL